MQENLIKQRIDSEQEVNKFIYEKEARENNVKMPNMDVSDLKVLQKGFVSLQ